MTRTDCTSSRILFAAVVVVAMVASGCVKKAPGQTLNGPSEFAISILLRAEPEALPRNGADTSRVTVTVRGTNGQPLVNTGVNLSVSPPTAKLSASSGTTNDQGEVSVNVTTLPATALGNDIVVIARPTLNSNAIYSSVQENVVFIDILGPSNATKPTPAIATSGTSNPLLGEPVVFTGAAMDEGIDCSDALCSFEWSFGDGGSATGRVVSHAYFEPGTFVVTLTVTDALGTSGTASLTISVDPGTPPTAVIAASPAEPAPGTSVTFDASQSLAAPGATIVSYEWVWGDGSVEPPSAFAQASHTYVAEGAYTVVLIVTDSLGRTGTAAATVPVTIPEP